MPLAPPPPDLKVRMRASYNAIAATYNEWTQRQHNEPRLNHLDELCSLVPRLGDTAAPAAILDIGCGEGVPVIRNMLWRNPGLRATANDLSDVQLGLARANLADAGDRVTFVDGDMMDLAFDDGSLTAVIALYSLLHLPQAEQAEMLGRIAGWLEPGGCLLANFVSAETEGFVMEDWLEHEKGWMFFSGLGAEKTMASLEEVGLTVMTHRIEEGTQERFLWVIAMKG